MDQVQTFQIVSQKQKVEEFSQEYIEWFSKNDQCTHVNIKGNSYSIKFFEQFAEYLSKQKELRRVNFNDIFVGRLKDEIPKSIEIFSLALKNLPIQRFDLSNNAVNPFGAAALKPFLSNASSLEVFLINNCGLGINGVQQIAEGRIIGIAAGCQQLQVFAIARNRVENEGAVFLAKSFERTPKLREFHIYQNGIKQPGMIALFQSLIQQKCQTDNQYCFIKRNNLELDSLDIRDNFIHKETSKFLGELISKRKMVALNISDCNIEDNVPILDALELSHEKLQRLSYQYGELNDTQGQRLLAIIQKIQPQIQKLELKGNEFKKATQKVFSKLFEQAPTNLGAFDSEDENEELNDLAREFSVIQI